MLNNDIGSFFYYGILHERWTMHVDGSALKVMSVAIIILLHEKGQRIEHAIHLLSPTTNNVAEYGALLVGVRINVAIGVKKVKIHTDSQLMAQQVNENFMPKEDSIVRYKEAAKSALQEFQ